jgi:hypothetical protein
MLDKLSRHQKIIMGISILVLIYAIVVRPILDNKKREKIIHHDILGS